MQTESELDILHLIPGGFIKTDHDCKILEINPKAKCFLRINEDAVLHGQRLTDYIDDVRILNSLWSFVRNGWKNISINDIQVDEKFLKLDGRVCGDKYIINITDNTITSKALDKATQSLLIGQENEKRRISKEIHDGIGQAISTVKMHLDFVNSKIEKPELKSDISRIIELISEIATDLRSLSHDLMPSTLVDFGLITAITTLIRRVNQSQSIYVHFENDLYDKDIDYNYALNIYRIVQELINNAIKHANCKEVKIKLKIENDIILLEVSDDGKGSSKLEKHNGIGLYNIKNRLASLNGNLKITTAKNRGFKVVIKIPMEKQKVSI